MRAVCYLPLLGDVVLERITAAGTADPGLRGDTHTGRGCGGYDTPFESGGPCTNFTGGAGCGSVCSSSAPSVLSSTHGITLECAGHKECEFHHESHFSFPRPSELSRAAADQRRCCRMGRSPAASAVLHGARSHDSLRSLHQQHEFRHSLSTRHLRHSCPRCVRYPFRIRHSWLPGDIRFRSRCPRGRRPR